MRDISVAVPHDPIFPRVPCFPHPVPISSSRKSRALITVRRYMKLVIRILVVPLLVALALTQLVGAESRGKALKRAEKEMRRANFIEAENIYRRLLETNRDDKEARLGLSFALIKLSKFQESYEHAAQALASDPINPRAHALLGTSLLRSGEFRVSIESLYTAF